MLLVVTSLSVTAFAQSTQPAADIVYKGKDRLIISPKAGNHTGTDLFGDFKGVMPGDTLTETVTFRNESTTTRTDYVKLYIVAVPHGADNLPVDGHIADVDEMNEFLSNFTMTVAQGGKGIFNGKPDEVGTFGGNGCLLGTFRKEDKIKALESLDKVGILDKAYMRADQLSGVQQQRVALARAIVTNPKVMLLDEPLSNLDPKLRETMRFEIKELQKKFNFTIIFVTHDQSEAMALSDRMMVMDMGNIVQIGTPTELYNRPVNRFVHKFLGQSTFTDVVIQDGKVYAKGDMAHPLPVALPENGEREMVMATRPNQIEMNHTDGYKTKVEKRIFLTNYTEYLVRVGDQLLQVQTPHRNAFAQGETCYLKFPGIMWYGREDEQAEAERNRRQLV